MMMTTYCAACCHLNLMDTSQEVIVETGRVLTPGVYRAASLRVCTTEELRLQTWTPVNRQTYRLKWQKTFTPAVADTLQNWATVTVILLLLFCLPDLRNSSLDRIFKGKSFEPNTPVAALP